MKGRWLTGEVGAKRVCELERLLCRVQKLECERELNQSFAKFEPWMTTPESREALSQFFSKTQPTGLVSTDLKYLRELAGLFEKRPGYPLSRFEFFEKDRRVLTSSDAEAFAKLSQEALEVVQDVSPGIFERWSCLVREIVPLEFAPGYEVQKLAQKLGSGVSFAFYRGVVFVSAPLPDVSERVLEHAINLVHELGHQSLVVYQQSDRLFESDPSKLVYSAVRKALRPAILSLHAAAALQQMCEFLSQLVRSKVHDSLYARQRFLELAQAFSLNVHALRPLDFTSFGRSLFEEMETNSETWLSQAQSESRLRPTNHVRF